MNEQEKNLQEFDLEDILKEFGDGPAEAAPETPEEAPAEPEFVREAPAEAPEEAPSDPQDTQVIPALGDTVRLDPAELGKQAQAILGQTQRFTALGDPEEPEPAPAEPEAQKPEPYSQEWEPEYEQPMGEYVPPKPIVFQPRSRLRELKKKLVAGPEKRYYELTELGVGKLQAAMLLSLMVVLLSAGATALYALDLVQPDRMKLMIFGQFFAIALSALLGSYQLMEGFGDMLRLRFSLNSLLLVTFVVCVLDGIFCLQELRVPCCAAFSLQVTMSLWSTYHKRTMEMGQMDTLRKAIRLDGLKVNPDYYEGKPGLLREEGQVEDFMEHYGKATTPDRVIRVYVLLTILVALTAGILGGVLHGLSAGFQSAAVTLLAAAPASFFVTASRPAAILEKRLHKLGTVICGWEGVERLSKPAAFPLSHEDLFPQGTAKLNGVKFYGSRDPDQVVAYATAMICANGGGLVPLFEQLLESRSGRHYDAMNLRAYGQGGIGGEVCGESVLVGLLPFMKDLGVEIPDGTRVNQAVYVAIDGELSGLFAVTYDLDSSAASGLRTLAAYRNLKAVLTTEDFMLTESFIRSKFEVRTRNVDFPEQDVRQELRQFQPDPEAPTGALTTKPGLAPLAFAVTGARVLRTACYLGLAMHLLAGILGMGMMVVLTWYGTLHLLTPINMFLYELVWLIPGLLLTEWTRTV